MDINVNELMNCQYFSNTRVLAGKNGCNRLVKKVRILDSLEGNLCFENGEVVLTTNESLVNIQTLEKEIIRKMAECNVAALVLNTHYGENMITKDILDEANKWQLPSISFGSKVSTFDITQFVREKFIFKINKKAKSYSQVYNEIAEIAFNYGYEGLVNTLFEWTWT